MFVKLSTIRKFARALLASPDWAICHPKKKQPLFSISVVYTIYVIRNTSKLCKLVCCLAIAVPTRPFTWELSPKPRVHYSNTKDNIKLNGIYWIFIALIVAGNNIHYSVWNWSFVCRRLFCIFLPLSEWKYVTILTVLNVSLPLPCWACWRPVESSQQLAGRYRQDSKSSSLAKGWIYIMYFIYLNFTSMSQHLRT